MPKGYPVITGDQQAAAIYSDETASPTTTVTRKQVPGGASFIELGLFQSGPSAPTAKFIYVAVNALSNSEEDYMLSTPATRIAIPVGEFQRIMFPDSDPCLRYAFATDVATETNGSKCIQRIGSLL